MQDDSLRQRQVAVDDIDAQIAALLEQRFGHSRAIGDLKREAAQPPYDPQRVQAQIERFVEDCAGRGLEPVMARQVISGLIAQVLVERLASLNRRKTSADREV